MSWGSVFEFGDARAEPNGSSSHFLIAYINKGK